MTISVIALYDDASKAQQAMNALKQAGCEESKIQFAHDGQGPSGDQLMQHLTQRGFSQHQAEICAQAIQQGRALLAADAPDDLADKAAEIMREHGARTAEDVEGELQSAGQQQGQQKGEKQSSETISEVEEKLNVGKRQTQSGAKVTTEVTEQPVEESVTLRKESIDVEHKDADRKLSPEEADKAFQEKSREFTATSEEAVAGKEAHVTGEVAINKSAQEQEETIKDKVRKTDVHVEETQAKGGQKKS